MDFLFTYMVFNFFYFYPMWDFTLYLYSNNFPLKCKSLPHLLSNKSHFQSRSNQWWFLELNRDYFDLSSHCCQHVLKLCTVATSMRPTVWLLCMDSHVKKTFNTKDFCVYGSVGAILLIWPSHQVESSTLISIVEKFEGIKFRKIYTNRLWANHISEYYTTFISKTLMQMFMSLIFTCMMLNFFIFIQWGT